jgi:hypothetical protein
VYRSQVKRLLDWTTNKVLPTLLTARPEDNELRNLDISRISNVSDSLVMSPPRQKADLRRTPTRFGRLSSSLEKDGPLFLISAFTASLLQSACVIFAEEITIGTSNGDDIAAEAVTWCKVFDEANEESMEGAEHILKGLVPGFVRLAIQLCRSCSNFMLLKELLVRCHEHIVGDERAQMKKAIASLLNARFGEESKLGGAVIETVLGAADELLPSSEMDTVTFEKAESIEELWSTPNGCVRLAIEVIVANNNASLALARRLVSSLGSQGDVATKLTIFEAKLLSLLMMRSDPALERITSDLDFERFQEDGEMRGVVQKLLGSVSA